MEGGELSEHLVEDRLGTQTGERSEEASHEERLALGPFSALGGAERT